MTSITNTERKTQDQKAVDQPQQSGRYHRQRLSEYADCVCLHNNRLNNLLTAELRFMDKDLRQSTTTIANTQRQFVTRFATSAVRSALERARLVGDRNAELRLNRCLRHQSADGDNRQLDSTVAVPNSSEFRRIMSGKVRLQRFVDSLVEGIGSASATAPRIDREDSAAVIRSVMPEEASPTRCISSIETTDGQSTTTLSAVRGTSSHQRQDAGRTVYTNVSSESEQLGSTRTRQQHSAKRSERDTSLQYGQVRRTTNTRQPRVDTSGNANIDVVRRDTANESNDVKTLMRSNDKQAGQRQSIPSTSATRRWRYVVRSDDVVGSNGNKPKSLFGRSRLLPTSTTETAYSAPSASQ